MKLTPKLIISFLTLGILPLLVFGIISVNTADSGLKSLAHQQLESVRDLKKKTIERYFETIDAQVITLADTQVVLQAMFYLPTQVKTYAALADKNADQLPSYKDALTHFYQKNHPQVLQSMPNYVAQLSPTAVMMQTDYLVNNPNDLKNRWKLNKAKSATAYHAIHTSMQPVVHKFIENAHFLDLYLVDVISNDVLYSVNKSADFGINLNQAPYDKTGLARAYQASKSLKQGETHFTDFSSYAAAQGLPVAFVSTPVVYEGKTLGILIIKINHDAINDILFDRSGMGSTGETFLVGQDKLLRTNAQKMPERFNIEAAFADPDKNKMQHPAVDLALNNQTGITDSESYTQTPTLTAYAPINIQGTKWAILAEMQNAEAFASSNHLLNLALSIGLLSIILISLIAAYLARSIAQPIHRLVDTLHHVHQSSDFKLRHASHSNDSFEMQQAGTALNALMQNLEASFNDIEKVMGAIAKGQFKERVTTDLHGDLDQLKTFVNASANSVEKTMNALSEVMQGISEGHFSVRLDASIQGELKSQVDFAMTQMEKAILTITDAMEFAAKGNFSHRVEGDLKGDMARLKNSVNLSLTEIQSAVDEITDSAKALAQGDLTQLAKGKHEGELHELQQAINHSIKHLNQMIEGVRHAANTVTHGANEISNSSQDLNGRTQQQAAALEQTAAAMEQMTASVRGNSEHALRAAQLSTNARGVTQKGVEIMAQTITAMKGIETASNQINDIIGLIDSVAFQTNLLALNAAVEAARAGEAGRGFAVVAAEVRNLAGRSAEAANQIKTLIGNAGQQIQQGTQLVNQSSQSLNDINQAIQQVNDIVNDISHSSAEQATGISQVNLSMTEMDQSTQQNATLVENLASHADNVDVQAKKLQDSVATFITQKQLK